jgi:hypothetical protein
MIACTGTLAEDFALPYVERVLPEFEAKRFEAHYYNCPACLSRLQALQAAAEQLRRHPIELPAATRSPLMWPSRIRVWGAVAAMLVLSAVAWRTAGFHSAHPAVAHIQQPAKPAPMPHPAAPPAMQASQLADLAMPAFVGASLRGESPEASFDAGMNAYSQHDFRAAARSLAQVPDSAREARAAMFYLGVCQMHLGRRIAALQALGKVADAGDSPQQEAALYYLAQLSLLNDDPIQAHRYLAKTIALRGDILARARAEDRQVRQLMGNRTANLQ